MLGALIMRRVSWVILILSILFIFGCSFKPSATIVPTASTPTEAPAPAATIAPAVTLAPAAGKSTVVGQVMSLNSDKPLAYQFVRLAEVVRQQGQGLYVLDIGFSPVGTSDANGNFIVSNIPPGEYVIIVGDIATSLQRVDKDGLPVVFTAVADQVLDVGKIRVMEP
jgi:hypothetical protein